MLCYKDKTFCPDIFKDCKDYDSKKCHRVLSENDLKKIEEGNWLVCYYMDKPSCYK